MQKHGDIYIVVYLCTMLSVWCIFHFHDALPKGEQYVKTEILSISTKNMYTTVDKRRKELRRLVDILQNHLTEKKGIALWEINNFYILIYGTRSTTWADLIMEFGTLQADLDTVRQTILWSL